MKTGIVVLEIYYKIVYYTLYQLVLVAFVVMMAEMMVYGESGPVSASVGY